MCLFENPSNFLPAYVYGRKDLFRYSRRSKKKKWSFCDLHVSKDYSLPLKMNFQKEDWGFDTPERKKVVESH
jgi:hypothetical protein